MTSLIRKYRIYCVTDNIWRYVWTNIPPTTCPDNIGHSVNANSVDVIQTEIEKNITIVDSPYFLRQEFVSCDTTGGVIRINLPDATKSEEGICYIRRTNGTNDITVHNNLNNTPINTITVSNTVNKFKSDGTTWTLVSINDENNIVEDLTLLLPNIRSNTYLPVMHNKGDILVSDDRSQTILPVGADGSALVADSNELLGVKWSGDLLSNISVEGATGATGTAQTGPIAVESGDIIRYWSENLTIETVDGSTGPNIKVDTPGPIGFGKAIGEFVHRWQQGQGANWRPFVDFTNTATTPIPQSGGIFWYRGTSELGGVPSTGYIIHNGFYKGGDTEYQIRIILQDLTNAITIFDETFAADPGGTNTEFAVPQRYIFSNIGTFPSGPAMLELQIQIPTGDTGKLYLITFY